MPVMGRPNVGKSSLVNRLVGNKVSIVAPKPQTTRQRIHGVLHAKNGDQVVFVDTPGLHGDGKHALNRYMNESATGALADVDLILQVVDVRRWTDEDEAVLASLRHVKAPVILAINKVDRIKNKNELLPIIEALSQRHDYAAVIPVSATQGDNCADLACAILEHMPEGPPLYPPDQFSDHGLGFNIAETVREKLVYALGQELPYALTVTLESLEQDSPVLKASAVIWVEREGQKRIVIGEGGAMLKRVGSAARRELEARTGKRVFLKLWVRVKEGWTDKPNLFKRFGYD
ncbi:MAG: GTPase Era [Sinobacteraceae bacterium]|nr:GTPase Era [Nevskiaceae bacterium]